MKNLAALAKHTDRWFPVLLALVVLILYAPSVHFGLIWDDPTYYQRGFAQTSLWQILTSLMPPTEFYRPVAVLYNRLFISWAGVVNVQAAHAMQIMLHLVITLTVTPVMQAVGLKKGHARLTALGSAICPLCYQAVAWQQSQQPLMLTWVMLAILAAWQFERRGSSVFLGLSLAAYGLALLSQEGAVPFVSIFLWMAWRGRALWHSRCWWPLLHLVLVLTYLVVWMVLPRQGHVTGQGFQITVLGYLLQGIVFPVAHLSTGVVTDWPVPALIALFALTGILLTLGAWKWESVRATMLNWVWIVVGILPIWAGLSWVYVELGPRLLYTASVGIAGLWAAWGTWAFSAGQPRWRRGLGGLVCVAVLAISLQQWWQFQKLYEVGTQHLARAVDVLSESPDKRMLFVNFPDRIELRPRPYPLGFWGVTLAPVVQNLSDYARAEVGRSGEDRSVSAFLVGADERRDWPYRVDMRGEDTSPEQLYQAAMEADAVYLTRYRGDGTLGLQWVGDIRPTPSDTHPTPSDTRPTPSSGLIAMFGDVARLAEATADVSASRELTLRLKWVCLKPLREHDTIFVHFWRDGTFAGEADGDSLGGLIPLSAWRLDTEILDVRQVDVSRFKPGQYEVRVGIYNRVDSARYAARGPGGQRFPEDEAVARILVLP